MSGYNNRRYAASFKCVYSPGRPISFSLSEFVDSLLQAYTTSGGLTPATATSRALADMDALDGDHI